MATIERRSWPINWRRRGSNFSAESASILLPKTPRSGHDHFYFRFENRPQSLQFRFKKRQNFVGILRRASWLWFRDGRSTIAWRSRLDQTTIVEFFRKSSMSSDWASVEWTVRSRSCSFRFDEDPALLVLPRGIRWAIRSCHLSCILSTCLIWWSRGLGSTQSMSSRWDPTLVTHPRRLQGKTVWEHSPTRRKRWKILRLNRGVDSPINRGVDSLYYQPTRGACTGIRVASYHVSAPPAPRAGHPGSTTWPQCRVAPRGGPARHVSRRSQRHPAG